jgi:endogenous inhibitor of DNA gyrase (YacG/DUF329 family)
MPSYRTIPRPCEGCGTEFQARASIIKLGKGRFCSDACRNVSRSRPSGRSKRVACICERCGTTKMKSPSAIAAGRGRFCSKRCQNASQENKVRLICETCGTPFDRKASAVKDRTFCSDECARLKHAEPIILDMDGVTARIPLHNRAGAVVAYALIDASDAEWAGQWQWSLSTKGYVVRGQGIRIHRDLLGLGPSDDDFGDHINLDKLDNRRSNLRPATPSESPQNVPGRPGTSQHRGVAWAGGNRPWQAYCNVGGIRVYSEFFLTEEEAAEAARIARAIHLPFATD